MNCQKFPQVLCFKRPKISRRRWRIPLRNWPCETRKRNSSKPRITQNQKQKAEARSGQSAWFRYELNSTPTLNIFFPFFPRKFYREKWLWQHMGSLILKSYPRGGLEASTASRNWSRLVKGLMGLSSLSALFSFIIIFFSNIIKKEKK